MITLAGRCDAAAVHITGIPDVIPVDFINRTVFRRRVNPNRVDAVIVEAVRPGSARSIKLGVAMFEAGRAVWIPNPDADATLIAGFTACVAAPGLPRPPGRLRYAATSPGRQRLLVPLPSW